MGGGNNIFVVYIFLSLSLYYFLILFLLLTLSLSLFYFSLSLLMLFVWMNFLDCLFLGLDYANIWQAYKNTDNLLINTSAELSPSYIVQKYVLLAIPWNWVKKFDIK